MQFKPTPVRKHPPAKVLLATALLLAVVAFFDWLTNREMAFFIFYFLPIATAAWAYSTRAGVITALISITVWLADDIALLSGNGISTRYSSWFVQGWNTGTRLVAFLTVALLVGWGRRKLERERKLREELMVAQSRIEKLSSLLRVCTCCQRVSDDDGQWTSLDRYLKSHSRTNVENQVCPDCGNRMRQAQEIGTSNRA